MGLLDRISAALRPKPEPEDRVDGMRFAGNVGPLIPKLDRDRLARLLDHTLPAPDADPLRWVAAEMADSLREALTELYGGAQGARTEVGEGGEFQVELPVPGVTGVDIDPNEVFAAYASRLRFIVDAWNDSLLRLAAERGDTESLEILVAGRKDIVGPPSARARSVVDLSAGKPPEQPLALVYLERWQPEAGWFMPEEVREAYVRATSTPTYAEAPEAWAELLYMLGDCGAAGLALLVARWMEASGADAGRIRLHAGLCLHDLGLIEGGEGAYLSHAEAARRAAVWLSDEGCRAWVARELAPFDGDLEAAARFSARLAAVRAGILAGPEEPTFEQLLDDDAWSLREG